MASTQVGNDFLEGNNNVADDYLNITNLYQRDTPTFYFEKDTKSVFYTLIKSKFYIEGKTNLDLSALLYLDGKMYKTNSCQTPYGRDEVDSLGKYLGKTSGKTLGNFSGIYNFVKNDFLEVIGHSHYVFYDKYRLSSIEKAVYKESVKGLLDYKLVFFKYTNVSNLSLININGLTYNQNEYQIC